MHSRILHTMLRITNLDRSIRFYEDALGMSLLRTFENTEQDYVLAFLGYDREESSCVIELTYNLGTHRYDIGNAYGHIAIGTDNCQALCDQVSRHGGRITRPPGPLKGGSEIIAFVEDPDGYKIEIVERPAHWF
ncbi:MAG: lactoylglutathione lyase [Pseudomonadota bacterium]|nr:lactoylglutathione lyase [Pseudomonadota bacterium]